MNEQDGVLLHESEETAPVEFTDFNLQGGWVYYAIFLFHPDREVWERAGTVDALVPYDFDSTEKLWSLIPSYYRKIPAYGSSDPGAGIFLSSEQTTENDELLSFIHILGYSFDVIRSEIDGIRDVYNPHSVHQKRLRYLAEQFGGEVYTDVPSKHNRNILSNLGLLHRKRGTVDGIKELVQLATGWDVEVSIGKNLMLSEDQASFENPSVSWWDPHTRYVVNDRVRHGPSGLIFEAKFTAYGPSQSPELTATDNPYWDYVSYPRESEHDTSLRRADTGDISTWQVKEDAGPIVPERTLVTIGVPDPEDPQNLVNALNFYNEDSVSKDFIVRSIPTLKTAPGSLDKGLVIGSSVPVPRARKKFKAGTTYLRGDLVTYYGVPYEAITDTTDYPTDPDTTDWKRAGLDDRIRLGMSMFVHGKFTGTTGAGSRTAHPYLMLFDSGGTVLLDSAYSSVGGVVYDSFYDDVPLDPTRNSQVGGKVWDQGVGDWGVGFESDGYYRYPLSGSPTFRAVTTTADGNVGVTFRHTTDREIGILFRHTDVNNYWAATTTGLRKVSAGVVADPASGAVSWGPFQAGDRMSINLNGDTITVRKNGVVVGTATDSFNNTQTRHGVFAG